MGDATSPAAALGDAFRTVLRLTVRDELQSLIQLTNEQQQDRLLNIEEASAMLAVSRIGCIAMRVNCRLLEN